MGIQSGISEASRSAPMSGLLKCLLLISLVLCPAIARAAESLPRLTWGHGQVALWLVIELHFLAIMVLAGSSLLAVIMDGAGIVLGRPLAIGDGLWRTLYSRLSVLFSMLGLAGLGVAGLFPQEARAWLEVFAPSFGTHVYFSVLGLAGGYGVLSCRAGSQRDGSVGEANVAVTAVVGILSLGLVNLCTAENIDASLIIAGLLIFGLPALLLILFRAQRRHDGLRLTFEALSALSFMVLVSIASQWRGVSLEERRLADIIAGLARFRVFYHTLASVCLVSLLELAWGRLASTGGVLSLEIRRAGGDDRWFLIAAVVSLTILPFTGYLASSEATDGSWLLAFQGALAAIILLALNHELWTRIELIQGPGTGRSGLWALAFLVGVAILIMPGRMPLTPAELLALSGAENAPVLALWGLAPAKQAAFTVVSLATLDATICMLRGEVQVAPLMPRRFASYQAAVWVCAGLSASFVALGFAGFKGQRAPGSAWDLCRILLLDVDIERHGAAVTESRREVFRQLAWESLPAQPEAGLAERLMESKLGSCPAVREAWRLRALEQGLSGPKERAEAQALRDRLERWHLAPLEWEALVFEELGRSERSFRRHRASLEAWLEARRDSEALKALGLDPQRRAGLIWPLLLLLGQIGSMTICAWLMATRSWRDGYRLIMAYAALAQGALLIWAHCIDASDAAVTARLYGADQASLLSLVAFIGGTRLALMACSTALTVRRDACLQGLQPSAEVLQKVEVLAAFAFVVLLALGGWAQSGAAFAAPRGRDWSSSGEFLLRLVTSTSGVSLGSAVKASMVLALGLIVFLAAARVFIWATQAVAEGQAVEEGWSPRWQDLLPGGVLGVLLLLYLLLEWRALAVMLFLGMGAQALRRKDGRTMPLLALFFALGYLVAGLEASQLDCVRRDALVRSPARVSEER